MVCVCASHLGLFDAVSDGDEDGIGDACA